MSDFIQDGTGKGYRAKVDNDNRLATRASISQDSTTAALIGNHYNVNTDSIPLTSSSSSGLLYMRNTDSVNWIFSRVFYNAGTSTGGAGDFLAEVVANPTGGTLISAGTAINAFNLNFGSGKTLTATILKGVEGSTVTGGETRISTILPASGVRVLIPFDSVVVEPGSSLAVRITPQTGNTSMNIQVGFNLHRFTD